MLAVFRTLVLFHTWLLHSSSLQIIPNKFFFLQGRKFFSQQVSVFSESMQQKFSVAYWISDFVIFSLKQILLKRTRNVYEYTVSSQSLIFSPNKQSILFWQYPFSFHIQFPLYIVPPGVCWRLKVGRQAGRKGTPRPPCRPYGVIALTASGWLRENWGVVMAGRRSLFY